ncbi:MAG: glutamate-5-semialdehyde dehydrogenase, partial [Planctomycetota bacterium]
SSDLHAHVEDLCRRARPAARALATCPDAERRQALEAIAGAIEAAAPDILSANRSDLERATADGLSAAMIDRLRLDEDRLAGVVADLRGVRDQADPVGRVLEERPLRNGIRLQKVSVPIGVVCIIFESRPNVTVDAAALCLRSGNACILRGGKEAVASNRAFAAAIRTGLEAADRSGDSVQLVMDQDRALIGELLKRDDAIDLVVPRGGEGLIRAVVEQSRIPVVKHDKGICSLYVHSAADLDQALPIVVNAKCQRPGVCNAIENLLVDRTILADFLPPLEAELRARNCEIRADEAARAHLQQAAAATEADWDTEYLDLILSIRTVEDVGEAVAFTNAHGSQHSDGILTTDMTAADSYLAGVDSACVYHNASTRFTDGAMFDLGAEVGISTNRLHARGPMGVAELCTYKYVLRGTGQVRD